MRHHHLFTTHVIETVALHLRERPLDRPLEGRRATDSMADVVSQMGQPRVRMIANERGADDASRSRTIFLDRYCWRRQRIRWRCRRLLCGEERNTDQYRREYEQL